MASYQRTMRHGKMVFQDSLRPYYSSDKWDENMVAKDLIFLSEQSSCPSGYTKVSVSGTQFLIAGISYQENAGGASSHIHTFPFGHAHTLTLWTGYNSATLQIGSTGIKAGARRHYHIINYGSSSEVSPGLGVGSKNNFQIQTYRKYILCKRN